MDHLANIEDSSDIHFENIHIAGHSDMKLANVRRSQRVSMKNVSIQNTRDPNAVYHQLITSINSTRLSQAEKDRLIKEVAAALLDKSKSRDVIINKTKDSLLNQAGSAAADYFIQLTANFSAAVLYKLIVGGGN